MQEEAVTGARLSVQQKWLWLAQQRQQSQPFRAQCAYLVRGALDPERLEDSLARVVQRFDVLRTAFHFLPGVALPVQVVAEDGALPLCRRYDFGGLEPGRREEATADLFEEMLGHSFDFERAPLMRAALVRLSAEEHVLVLGLTGFCADKAGLRNLVREVSRSYAAQTDDVPPMQYADLAEVFNDLLWSDDMALGRDYWLKKEFAGLPAASLPFALETTSGEFAPRVFGSPLRPELVARLEEQNARSGLSLQSVLLACWQVLLWRLTGNADPSIAVTYDGRNYKELVDALGLFERSLPHPARLSPEQSFGELAAGVMARSEEMGEWQEYFSWEMILKERDEAAADSFGFGFEYDERSDDFSDGDIRFVLSRQYTCLERRGVKLVCARHADGSLTTEWLYDGRRFQPSDIERVSAQYAALLRSVAAEPDAPIHALDVVGEQERRQLLSEFNHGDAGGPAAEDCVEVIERQAERTPDRTALTLEGECLTYRELNARANRLANYLRRSGVEPGTLVGICLERSFEMVVSLLAVLKAGASYVPLDPEYPPGRLTFMLENSQARVLLTHSGLAEKCAAAEAAVVCVDSCREAVAREGSDNPHVRPDDEALAYVLYTSGSTGRPKGAMITRGALNNHMAWMCGAYPLHEGDTVVQKTAFSFDASVWEFYAPLMQGARLLMAAPGGQRDISYLCRLISDERVTVLQVVPTVLQLMLDSRGMEGCRALRRVYCGGEALTVALAERFRQAAASADLINLYGPTETCIDASHWRCADEQGVRRTLIGRAIDGLRMYVLDERRRLSPIWAAGELHIAGAGVARGYLRRPDLTAERFLPDALSGAEGSRLYQTGDLARVLPDGNVEYLGRVDHQVKIRGQRVELAEVESSLTEHPRVRQAVAVANGEREGTTRLIAYVVAEGEQELSGGELRDWMKERLPEYMVPSVFVRLAALPLTPNGKVDRRQLPEPEAPSASARREPENPRTSAERLLAQIWREVLGVEEVGVFDNFFELGGDSILAIQVIARASQAGLQLTPKLLFKHQTVAALAAVAQPSGAAQAEQGAVAGPVPLTPWVRWFFEQQQPDPHHWNQSIVVRLRRRVSALHLEHAVARLTEHHDALRMRFTRTGDGWQQHNAAAETRPVFSHFDLSHLAHERGEQEAEIERVASRLQTSLDLAEGPLARVALFDMGAEEPARLLVIIHHLVVDGVSWRVLLEDLQRACEQQERGEAVELAAKTTSYRQWAEGLLAYASSDELNAELPYWLDAVPERVEPLPTDYPSGENLEAGRRSVSVSLTEEETGALIHEVPQAYSTQINDALLAALAEAFSRWADGGPLLIALEGHGREQVPEDADLTRTVGWFTSFAPVLLKRVDDDADPGEVLQSVKEQLRRMPHHGVGYGVLRYLSADAEKLRALPEPEVSFNYLGQLDQSFGESSLFGAASEAGGATRSPRARRFFVLEVDSLIAGGRLRVSFNYGENNYRRATIEGLAEAFIEALRRLIAHCLASKAGRHTPSDFPLARLTQAELDRILGDDPEAEDIFPLTPLQQGMLYHSLFAPESGVYIGQLAFTLHTDLDLRAFERAWQRVVDVNPTLRTTFRWEGLSEALQVVQRQAKVPMLFEDWRDLAPEEQLARLRVYLAEDLRRGFNLSEPPLMRVALMRVEQDRYFFVWTQHHLLLDGWSLPLVRSETYAHYQAFREGGELQPEPRRPFRSYIEWLQAQDLTKAERFWRETLRGFTTPVPIGTESSLRGEDPAYAEELTALSAASTESLQRLARQHQLTLGTVVQGAWALLLSHYGATDDVVFGIVVSGRPAELAGVGSMLGLLMNTLPLRARVNQGEALLDWLRALQEQRVEMSQYEFSPLLQVQEWSEVRRGVPLFESVLVFENFPTDDAVWQRNRDLQAVNMSTAQWTHYPLALIAIPGAELRLQLSYDCRRLDRETVGRMLRSLERILEGMAGLPQARLSEITASLNGREEVGQSPVFEPEKTYENDQFVF
jgi:amino acid adenylation domain-containing protein/non-ribosomal peptide synthase protein (TIGR01720 family)